MKYPDIFLANKAQSIIGVIQCVHNLKITLNLNDVDTVSFTCDKYSNGIENEYYKSIEDLMLIFMPKYGWFEITVTEHTDGYDWYKEVSAESLEVELGQHILRVLQANSTEDDGDTADEDYVKVLFFNPLDVEHSLMHKVLKNTYWKPGHIDNSLWHKSRSFDIENQDVYSFLTGEVSTQYNCLFQFDTFTKSVNAYDLDNYGEDTNIYMDMETLVQSIDISCNKDNIKTCLYVDGGENIDVRDVNINGTNKIYNFDYYKKYFKTDTRTTYEQYIEDCKTVKESDEYTTLVEDIKNKLSEIAEINYRMPSVSETILDYDSMSEEDWKIYEQEVDLSEVTDWNACGVWLLETRLQLLKDNEELYQEDVETYCKETSPKYADYEANHNLLVECEAALNTRKTELNTAQNELEQLKQQKINLINSLAVENYFTDEQWEEISAYIREDTYSNDSYLVYATDSSDYVIETTQALYDAAAKELDKYCKPQYSFSSTIANLFKIPEFTDIKKDFSLGNFIRLGVDGLVSKLRLIKIDIDFETEDIGVEYSDAIRTENGYCDAASIQALASSVSSTVSFNKTQWNNGGYAGEYVDRHFGNGLNTGDIEITSKDGNLNINKSGILLTDGNSLKQAKWLNNKLLFTKDGWKTVESAFGEITYTDPLTGETVTTYGLVADAIIGNLLLGQQMVIANPNTTFQIGEEGLIAYSQDKNTVLKINPNATDKVIEVLTDLNSTEKSVFYISANGEAYLSSEINAGKGHIGGWIIDNNSLTSSDFGDYTTGTSGLGLYSDGNILNRGQWSGQDNPWYAYLYRGKWIFGLGNYYGAVADERYSDISANGIYMRSKDTITNSGNQYLFAVDTGEDTVNITNSSTSPGLTIYNNGNGASLQIKNATSGWVNRAFGGEIVIGTDENGDKKTANISIFGEKEYGRLVLRTDLGNDVDCDCGAVGTQNFRWNEGYFNQLYSTKDLNDSDAKIKDIHGTLDKEKSLEFINSLNPCEYNFKKSNHQRTHMGFIAQEVNQIVKEQELGDLAIYEAVRIDEDGKEYYYSEEYPDEELKWSLNYNEFIAPIVSSVQLLSDKINALENRVNTLEQENSELKKEIKELKGVE